MWACDGGGHPQVVPSGFESGVFVEAGWLRGLKGTFQRCGAPGGLGTLPTTNLEVQMKMVKSLLLGSAAGLVAVGGAQAADLPVKAKPVEYVKICSLYGAG